ncbi:hypothetical protein V130003_22890 [Vibrio cholerae]|nr:hypothetical protein V130003_22890 [Vibrio cholerae]
MSMKGKETMSKQNEKLVVGKLGSSYGIRGWLKVFSYTDNPEVFLITALGILTKRASGWNTK